MAHGRTSIQYCTHGPTHSIGGVDEGGVNQGAYVVGMALCLGGSVVFHNVGTAACRTELGCVANRAKGVASRLGVWLGLTNSLMVVPGDGIVEGSERGVV